MATKPSHPTEQCWSGRVRVGLLLALTAWTSAWHQAQTWDADSVPMRPLGAQIHAVVHEGQLSVDVREAQARGLDHGVKYTDPKTPSPALPHN
jgi:hypothetical protein